MPNALETLVADMTLAELASRSGRSVDEIVGFALRSGSRLAAPEPRRAPAAPTVRRTSTNGAARPKPNPKGNKYQRAAAYTEAVGDVLRGASGPLSAAEIRATVGGTAARLQLALARLIAQRTITHDGGSTSARRYLAAR